MKTRRGFTLVELLTVIVIILILGGITMRLMALVGRKTGIARAAGDIERIKHALTEYYAVYGCFPPAGRMDRQFEAPGLGPAGAPFGGTRFYDGLTTYLFNDPNQERWAKYLDGWPSDPYVLHLGNTEVGRPLIWSNRLWTIRDPWNNSYIYTSSVPYQTYLLFSAGPDGNPYTAADNVGDKWME